MSATDLQRAREAHMRSQSCPPQGPGAPDGDGRAPRQGDRARTRLAELVSRCLGACLLVIVLGGSAHAVAAQAAEPDVGEASPGTSRLLGDPLVVASVDRLVGGQQQQAARQARRSNPFAVAERMAAHVRFENLTPGRAASEARAAFPALIERLAGGVPRLTAGQRIVRYPTDHAAQVSLSSGRGTGVIESLAPIATRSFGGRHVPLDLRLTHAGDRFEAVRPEVAVEVPRELAQGVSLPGVGVSLTPVNRHGSPLQASAGALTGSAVLWASSGERAAAANGVHDLSTLAKASPAGFDLTTILFSQRSPGQLYFRVGTPAAARLRHAENGSVQILEGKAPLAAVAAVSAEDAEGTSVPVAMRIHGHTLELSVDTHGDYLYPIVVDPEVNDSQLAKTTAGKRSNWEFFTSNAGRFGKAEVYEGPGAERLETKGISSYAPAEWAYWGYQTQGVSHIYEIKTETSAHNRLAKIESTLNLVNSGGLETRKVLSTEAEPEYEKRAASLCALNGAKEECLPASGKAGNAIHFQQEATGTPTNPAFADTMAQGIVSIAEPVGTHSTTSYNRTSPTLEFEAEIEGKKEKVKRNNALFGASNWLSKVSGAVETIAQDTGIGVARTKLEYESTPGHWSTLGEHNYLEVEAACKGVQCYTTHSEYWTLPAGLPDGEQKLRYKGEEAITGTQSLESEGTATVKVDSAKPHGIAIGGLPFGNELSERPYELTVKASDGEGSTVASSGIKSIALFIDGHEFGTAGGSCSVAKGECTASTKWTVNGAELGSGQHDIEIVALDNAGNEERLYEPISIRHSTPVALGPGSVDLQSGDFTLGANDVPLGSGLTVGRNYTSRNTQSGETGPLGPQWSISLGSTEGLIELVNGSVMVTTGDGGQAIFAAEGAGKYAAPPGDSNLELSLEENKATKEKLAYYLKNAAAHTSVKFTKPPGASFWVPAKQEGTVATDAISYAYQLGKFVEYPVSGEVRPQQIITGPDGNLWFMEGESTPKIAKITPTGTITEYATGTTGVRSIAAGADGNVWFTSNSGGEIGKITPGGTVTRSGGGCECSYVSMIPGPSETLWSIRVKGSERKIRKLVAATEASTEYTVPEASYLAEGGDGNIWFTESSAGKVGKITPTGTITEYALSAGSKPYEITQGPDGSLWAAVEKSGSAVRLDKVLTTGAVAGEYVLPTGTEVRALTTGPDSNVWVADTAPDKILKITPKGAIVGEYSLPGPEEFGATPEGIAAGPEGNIWFTGAISKKVGVIPTTGPPVEPTEELAPKPAGVSCEPEFKAGCRALKFKYASSTTATGEGASQWGDFQTRLTEVLLKAYDPPSKTIKETAVAKYAYDKSGRLRAEWDPRISPSLKRTYGYDLEGHVTSLAEPGQEPWTFTYGTLANDAGAGRLLKAARAPASAELWSGEPIANTEAPKMTGTVAEGKVLGISRGAWSGSPLTYSYAWKQCNSTGVSCKTIPGATGTTYRVQRGDVGHELIATVTATNGGGSVTAATATTVAVPSVLSETAVAAGAEPRAIGAITAGSMWFTDHGNSSLAKYNTATGGVVEFKLPEGSAPEGIANGSDMNVWFTENGTSKIGKMTSSLVKTEYALPAGSHPKGIVNAAGALWFTENGTNKIGKITTAGAITEYALPAGSAPTGISTGPDGNVWFTDSGTNKIGKITSTGTITEYALPAGSVPVGIALWVESLGFIDSGTGKVGKITTSGSITEWSLPAGSSPEYVAHGGENLWITSKAKNAFLRVKQTGAISEYPLPAGSQPQGFFFAGNEDWFTEANDKIGKVNNALLTGVEGEALSAEPGISLGYGVPVTGSGAPREMSAAEVARWGQSDKPAEATAVFAADEPQGTTPSSFKRATVYYLDEQGRQVNVASPSTATYGAISTTEYNQENDVIRTLSPDNRATALAAGASSVEKSKLLDTQNTFNGEGAKEGEAIEPGSMLIETLGPQHQIKYRAGGEVKESLARNHTKFVYDQGAPGGETYHLLTEQYDLAQLANHEEVEVRTEKKSYSGQSNLGWKLRAPTSVTVDPEGLSLTTTTEYDSTTGQVTEVRGAGADRTLSYAMKFGETGTEAGKLKAPWGVAVNGEGKLWVVDSANNRVEEFGPEGSYVAKFGEPGSGNGQLSAPRGIALDSAGHIWVADTGNNRLEEFSSAGAYMSSVGSLGTESGKFKAPSALAFDPKGNIWVADSGNSRVEKFDKEAKYASEFGAPGSEPGKLAEPKGIAIDSGEHIWVADTGNNRIQEFSTSGSLLKHFGSSGASEGQLNTPIDLKIDGQGNVWTVDSLNNRVASFSPNGAYLTQLGFKGTEAGQLTEPRALAFDATGKAWITDSSNNRLEQWSKGPNAHDQKTIYYSSAANGEYPTCGSHPEWAGLVCETLPARQPELMGLPKLPVTVTTYNMFDEPETITETFGSTTRTKRLTYDAAGRKASSETTASTGVSLPKVNFTYSSDQGALEKQSTEGEGKTLASEFNRLGQLTKYTDADGNVAKYKYAGPENDFLIEEASDSSASGTSKQTYEYDATTKQRTKLIDSAAGTFTASYDTEGKMTSVSYPYGMCANYTYNSVGEATNVSYLKSSNCSEGEAGTYYTDTRLSSVRGELLSQSSTLASEGYAYDTAGRLIETQETPAGEGCTVRAYAYDEAGNRASSIGRTPGGGGACQTEGGTIEGHNYDEANRLADSGVAYDGLGNVTKLPPADAEGKELTSTFYVDNAVATQTQGGVTNEYKLDPEGRVRETTRGTTKTKSHYDGPGETPAWTENAEQWVRNIPGIDGELLATQTNGATPVIQLHDLQGNVVGTIGDKAGETKLLSSYNSTEFGVPNAGKVPPKFAWLGATGIESSFSTGVVTYGSTSYVPQTGRALQSEQVEAPGLPGGSGAGAAYVMQEEPWNMQWAAASAAEAPGREAAREREAMESAANAITDPWVQHFYNLKQAASVGESFFEAESAAVVLSMFDLPETFLEILGKVSGDAISQFDDAYKWLYDAGEKLIKCSTNRRGLHHCRFEYDQDEWDPEIPFTGIHPFGKLTWPNFSVEPTVYECRFFSNGGHECPNEVHIKTEL
jgi:streptogramin lyase